MIYLVQNIAIQPLRTYVSKVQVINCSVTTPVSNHRVGSHFLLRPLEMDILFPAHDDTTPKSVSTFVSYVIAAFTASEENFVSQQRSCDNELCRNTKNKRYLDPARSSHV